MPFTFKPLVRETSVHCPELKHRTLITLTPVGAKRSVLGNVEVPGLKKPIRVWLRPLSNEQDALQMFVRRRLYRDDKGRLLRPRVGRAWRDFLREDPYWWNVKVRMPDFYRELEKILGPPNAEKKYVGWRLT